MRTETNERLLPQIIEKKLKLGLNGATISLKDFEIALGKSSFELSEIITEKICLLPTAKAEDLWSTLDETSRFKLIYPDDGTLNLELSEKLNLGGDTLQKAFVSIHARSIFDLENTPISTPAYNDAFTILQTELLAICKQLYASKPAGKRRLTEFLNGFETEFLASSIRHEIARYFIDEQGAELEWDGIETDKGIEYLEKNNANDDEHDENSDNYQEPEALEGFKNTFTNGSAIITILEFTHWLQQYAPEIFSSVRNYLIFFSNERGLAIWERQNPVQEHESNEESKKPYEKIDRDAIEYNRDIPFAFARRRDDETALVSIDSEKEYRRLIRVYSITSPLKNDFFKVGKQDFQYQGELIAKILRDTGKKTGSIQTFEQLRKAVWDAVGFTHLRQWVYKQKNPELLISSSEKKWLFDEMKVLGCRAFGTNAIFFDSLERSKLKVVRLYGWLSLVKIFWNIADQKRRFSDLASVKSDTVVWEENITCCTLIIQLVLGTDKLFFSLDDLIKFCKLSRTPGWDNTMKQSFQDLAEQNGAISAVPIFDEYIDHLSMVATNAFRIDGQIHLATKAEREIVFAVKELAEKYLNHFVDAIVNKEETEDDIKEKVLFLFFFGCAAIPGISKYRKEADDYLNHLIAQLSPPSDVNDTDLPNIDIDESQLPPNDFEQFKAE